RSTIPAGPTIEDTAGRKATHRTYQDLLHDTIDEARFERLATAQLARVSIAGGEPTLLGAPAMFLDLEPSPDDRYVLVYRMVRPFSYEVPYDRFPRHIEVLDRDGGHVATVAEQGLADEIPIGGVRTGARNVGWHPQQGATLLWWDALDGGDPKREVPHRDRVLLWASPFRDAPEELVRAEHRLRGVSWTERPGEALVREFDRDRRWTTARLHVFGTDAPPRVFMDRSVRDVYGDPGDPIGIQRADGTRVIRVDDGAIFLVGAGASPEGERPFLDRVDLATGAKTRWFESAPEAHEQFAGFIGAPSERRWLVRRETPTEVPNYWRVSPTERERITHFSD